MKKLFRILVTLLVAISLVACTNGGGNSGKEEAASEIIFWTANIIHHVSVPLEGQ